MLKPEECVLSKFRNKNCWRLLAILSEFENIIILFVSKGLFILLSNIIFLNFNLKYLSTHENPLHTCVHIIYHYILTYFITLPI